MKPEDQLNKFVEENMVAQSCGYYEGVKSLNLVQINSLLALAETVRIVKMAELLNNQ